mgnify:CR=1
MNLTDAILKLRDLGLSDEAIARLAGVNTSTVWRARKSGSALYSHAMKIIAAAEKYLAAKDRKE